MKDWHIPLTELTNGQVANLFYLANLAGLDVYNLDDGLQTNIGACNGHFSLWIEKDGKQITYKKAVKKLHKLIDKDIEKEAKKLYREVFGPPADVNCRCVMVDKSVSPSNKAKKHIIEAAKAMGIKPEDLE